MKKIITLTLLITVCFMTIGSSIVSANSYETRGLVNDNNYQMIGISAVPLTSLEDGTTIERKVDKDGVITDIIISPDGKSMVVSTIDKIGMITEDIIDGKVVARYITKHNSPDITIERGQQKEYINRNDYIKTRELSAEELQLEKKFNEINSTNSIQSYFENTTDYVNSLTYETDEMNILSTVVRVPNNHYRKWSGEVGYRGCTAIIREDYITYYGAQYTSRVAQVGEPIALIASILGIPILLGSTAFAAALGWIGGVWAFTTVLTTFSYGNAQRYWYRDVEVLQDPNGYSWYRAWHYFYVQIASSDQGPFYLSDQIWGYFKNHDFDDIGTLGRTGIDNYLWSLE